MGRISHWTPHRWSLPVRSQPVRSQPVHDGTDSRAACVFALVQQLADLAADAENAPARRVPRLDNDLALPDQLRVMIADLLAVRASPEMYQQALTLLDETAQRL